MLIWLTAPFAYDFMQRALVVAVLVGAICALLSCYLVLKGWSLMGDAISHAVLPGIVIAQMLKLPIALGAFVAGLGCALSVGYLKDNSRIKEDAVMGIVFSGMFALGLVLFRYAGGDQHLTHILFGNMLGVTWGDVVETAGIVLPASALVLLLRKDLMLVSFDPSHARAMGLPVRLLQFGLLALLAVSIVASIKAVGVILVIAMLIGPGAIGFLLTKRFDAMLMIALAAAITSSITGTILSFHLDAATGPLIVVTQAGLFAAAVIARPLLRAEQ
jgi:manganese/iron transport system permease protein